MPDISAMTPAIAGGVPFRAEEDQIIYGAPVIGEAEVAAVARCMRSRWIGSGPMVREFEIEFAKLKNARYSLALNSGSAALHLALLAIGVGEGDEVIVPTMTFCASAHAVIHAGATPVLVDCELSSYNIDPALIERSISSRTKAIMVVHIGGRCCQMDRILKIAEKHQLKIIEDCAHAIESDYRGLPAGLIGDVGCFSFYATKSITTADGGMLITNNEDIYQSARRLASHGMNNDAWSRIEGKGNAYDVFAAGFKYNMTDIEASIGLVQLAGLEERWQARRRIWNLYGELLVNLPLLVPAPVGEDGRHGHHIYSVLLDIDALTVGVAEVVEAMRSEHIGTGVHYTPVHMLHYYAEQFGYAADNFPTACYIGRRTLSLPLNADLTDDDVRTVVKALGRILAYYSQSTADNSCRLASEL